MQGTLVFVHGTGVRQAGYARTLQAVEASVGRVLPGVCVVGVDWGDQFGVPVEHIPLALPEEVVTRDVTGAPLVTEPDRRAALWTLLLDDPLFELRVAAQRPAGATGVGFGPLPSQAVLDRLDELAQTPPDVTGTGVRVEELVAAIRAVRNSPELLAAARASTGPDDPDLAEAIARATVAQMLAAHRFDEPGTVPPIVIDGNARDALVRALVTVIVTGRARSASDWIRARLAKFVEKRATALIDDRRAGLMGTSTPGLGDILAYQRRSDDIRSLVADRLVGAQAQPPVVAVGHSLGGIILVDVLSGERAPEVQLLVTVGSQAPLFYVIDALGYLRPGHSKPQPFVPWLNIYNRQDFLSFCAARVFTGVDNISDEEVDPGVPFPPSHSAYWHHQPVYELIHRHWPPAQSQPPLQP
jgi:hypothetical protein